MRAHAGCLEQPDDVACVELKTRVLNQPRALNHVGIEGFLTTCSKSRVLQISLKMANYSLKKSFSKQFFQGSFLKRGLKFVR